MNSENNNLDESTSPVEDIDHHTKRLKVRKRIRVKKKHSPKKKIKKFFEMVLWAIFIIGFAITLIYLFKELDLSDARFKKK